MANARMQRCSRPWKPSFVHRGITLLAALAFSPLAQGQGAEPSEEPILSHLQADRGPPTREAVNKEELHRWGRHIQGFRSEHNFALSTGISSGVWHVNRFGPLVGEDFDGSGVFARFQYSFHLQLYRGFGYFLGSSLGYHYESADQRKAFRPSPAAQYPGLLGGLVLNISPMLRTSISFDTYLERHDGIDAGEGSDASSIYVTMQAFDVGAYLDLFYDLLWAFRLEAHKRHLTYNRPGLPTDTSATYPVHAGISKDDEWLGLGIVFHLL